MSPYYFQYNYMIH